MMISLMVQELVLIDSQTQADITENNTTSLHGCGNQGEWTIFNYNYNKVLYSAPYKLDGSA